MRFPLLHLVPKVVEIAFDRGANEPGQLLGTDADRTQLLLAVRLKWQQVTDLLLGAVPELVGADFQFQFFHLC